MTNKYIENVGVNCK